MAKVFNNTDFTTPYPPFLRGIQAKRIRHRESRQRCGEPQGDCFDPSSLAMTDLALLLRQNTRI